MNLQGPCEYGHTPLCREGSVAFADQKSSESGTQRLLRALLTLCGSQSLKLARAQGAGIRMGPSSAGCALRPAEAGLQKLTPWAVRLLPPQVHQRHSQHLWARTLFGDSWGVGWPLGSRFWKLRGRRLSPGPSGQRA